MGRPPLVLSRLAPELAPHLGLPRPSPGGDPRFDLDGLAGRLVELGGQAALTCAFGLVLEAQRRDEPAAYVTGTASSFYPPDAAQSGVDLEALVVVRTAAPAARVRAAEELLRSGAFAVVLVDLHEPPATPGERARPPRVPPALLSRLLGLAQKHHATVVFLAEELRADEPSSLGSLISLRAVARRAPLGEMKGRFVVALEAIKDKRRAPGWTQEEVCVAPVGLV